MKERLFGLISILIILFVKTGFADPRAKGGELLFDVINPFSGRFNLTVSTADYAWAWDKQNSIVYLLNNYSRSLSNLQGYTFDSPKDIDDGMDSIAWGVMTFTITSLPDQNGMGVFSFTFTLDLRDEEWSHDQTKYPGSDTHFRIDQHSSKVYAAHEGVGNTEMTNNASYTIWGIWFTNNPLQTNFKVPVTLKNRIEGQYFDFGNLIANGQQINSGNSANYQFNSNNSVNVGTTEYTYQNQRNYNFKWDYSNGNITQTGNLNLYNPQFNFNIEFDPNEKSITRNFRKVYPLTIKNSLDEVGGISTNNIYFKDPITDNAYHSYSAGNGGFVKDNAFDSLDIDILPLEHQKYGAKAVSTISYNARTYQYSGGDFSTSGTDFIITGPTTKTAYYKGAQLSSQTDAIAGNGQKKIVKTSDGYLHQVYESLNKVWYERSTDNGVTWQVMNNGQAVSANGYKAKGASIDYYTSSYNNIIIIVYQQQTFWGTAINANIYENGAKKRNEILVNYYHASGDFDIFNAKPVVSINPNAQVLIAWYVDGEIINSISESGLYYKYGYIYLYYGISWYFSWYTSAPVAMSNANYITISNPTLDTYKSGVQPFQLAYERSNTIYYRTLTDNSNHINHIQEGGVQNISSGGGYTFNNNPSLIAVNGGARVVWEGKNSSTNRNIVFRDPGYYYFWSFNSTGGYYDCLNPNINRPNNYPAYFFGWSENNNGYVLNNSLSYINIKYLGINGQYMQLNNGATPGEMYATTLNTSGSPYYFTKSPSSIGSL